MNITSRIAEGDDKRGVAGTAAGDKARRCGTARGAIVEGEGCQNPAVAGADRARPAGAQAQGFGQGPIIVPQRIGADVDDFDGLVAIGGGAAGADLRADQQAIECARIGQRQARRREGPQMTGAIDREDGADRFGRQRLDATAQQIGNDRQRFARGNRFQNFCLETQQQSALSDHETTSDPIPRLNRAYEHVVPCHQAFESMADSLC